MSMNLNLFKSQYFKLLTKIWSAYAKVKVKTYGKGLRVNYRSHFTKNTFIGNDCHFNGIEIVGNGKVIFGDHFHSGSLVLIITQTHNYESPNALPYDENDIVKDVVIGKNCWIGSRVIILPGTTIEDGVVVQAGSVLFGKVPSCSVVGGNPWKIIKYRDISKYELLEKNKKYVGWRDD